MRKPSNAPAPQHASLARLMPLAKTTSPRPEGAVLADGHSDSSIIAVVYNHGDTPPEITITDSGGQVLTVHANGAPVAVVAKATGPGLTPADVVLVERFMPRAVRA